jgi:N-acetylmuramoyl-L-alanine amidase
MGALRVLVIASFVLGAAGTVRAGVPTINYDGRAYVELGRIADALRAKVETTPDGVRTQLRGSGHVVTFTRNWARIVVDGKAVVLDAPVRVKGASWLVPADFLDSVMPGLAAAPAAPAAAPRAVVEATLSEIRVRSYPSFTRVVVESSAPVSYRMETPPGSEVRVRLGGLKAAPRTEAVGDGLVGEVRLERQGAETVLRVVFQGSAGEAKASTLADPPRLVFDFLRPADQSEPAPRGEAMGPLRTIVLDAGHGGGDSGAVGPAGLMEKELVLDVTRRVARLLEDRLDVKVLLSRDADHFIPLRDRTSFANRRRADLFVSIHANAHRESASEGVETYFLSSEATDSEARQVAAEENAAGQPETPAARGRADAVRMILWDLAQSEFQLESSRLAEIVQDSMTQSLRIPNRGVKQAGFYVLGGAAMPAILIEIGFVTNPKEERRLKESRYRDEIARAIAGALTEYKRHYDERMRTVLDRAR